MAASVVRAAEAYGLTRTDIDVLSRAYAVAMSPRVGGLPDEEHPAFLHPGRSMLILLYDVGPLPAEILAAAAVHESADDSLRASGDVVREALGDAVADIVDSLPLPGDESLAERLITLDEGPRLAALAERLDYLRHLHLSDDRSPWRPSHEEAGTVWLPVAERTHSRLADRFRNWHKAFGRRLRRGQGL